MKQLVLWYHGTSTGYAKEMSCSQAKMICAINPPCMSRKVVAEKKRFEMGNKKELMLHGVGKVLE